MTRKATKGTQGTKTRGPAAQPVKHAGGRPSDYKKEFARQAYRLCLLGATDRQLAEFFSVSEVTLNAWKQRYPEFLKALKRGKAEADSAVAESLYRRALGYSHKAVKIFPSTKDRESEQVEYTEHYPPDTAAGIFWLKNRQPGIWRDKQQVEHSGPEGGAIQVEEMDANQIRAELAKRGALPSQLLNQGISESVKAETATQGGAK